MPKNSKIVKLPKLNNPVLLVAWPGMGEVAFKTADYLISALKAVPLLEIDFSDLFYPISCSIKDGVLSMPQLPSNKVFYWINPRRKENPCFCGDLVIFLSNAQPDLAFARDYAERIFSLAKKLKIKKIIGCAAMPAPIEHTQEPQVWFSATDAELINELKKFDLQLMTEGQISGMNGLFLALAKEKGFQGLCLLGEIPLYTIHIENPSASRAVLQRICKILDISIDLSGLEKEARAIALEINKLLDYFKLGAQKEGPISEDEIERIKKSLSQYTKLPLSVKQKIDKLFEEAKKDISKAKELKKELDYWSVYKDYEDKFLDLFKRPGGKSQ